MVKKKIAKTGKIVSKKFADEHPATTFEMAVEVDEQPPVPSVPHRVEKKVSEIFVPEIGEKFDLDGLTLEVVSYDPLQVIQHKILNNCQTQWKLDVDNIDGALPLTKAEAFIRLAK